MKNSIFTKAKERIHFNSPEYEDLDPVVQKGISLLKKFNTEQNTEEERRQLLNQLFDQEIDPSTIIMPPFSVDFANQVTIGKGVYINKDVSLVSLGGITIEDGVLIAAKAIITSINHDENPAKRRDLLASGVHIKENAWIGAGAIVTHDIPDNMVVVGNPAKVIREIRR